MAAVDDAAELVTERGRRLLRQQRVPSPECLQVGAVGERELDLHEHVARPGLGPRNVLDAQVTGAVEPRCPHGTKTTFRASPRRYRSTPSTKRSSGIVVTSGNTSVGTSSTASRKYAGVAEREPTTCSSLR